MKLTPDCFLYIFATLTKVKSDSHGASRPPFRSLFFNLCSANYLPDSLKMIVWTFTFRMIRSFFRSSTTCKRLKNTALVLTLFFILFPNLFHPKFNCNNPTPDTTFKVTFSNQLNHDNKTMIDNHQKTLVLLLSFNIKVENKV